jgi:hypothetical protein
LGSFGHNSLEHYAYFSSSWPCTIIPIRVMGNCLSQVIILLHTCNLRSAIFAWSILSWIMHRNSSFNHTNIVLQIWYNFLYDSWCKICFLSFASYFRASLLFFLNLDIKSLRDSQIVHFKNMDPRFHTSTFKWFLFLNLLITNWEIHPMFNSLFIYQPKNIKKRNIKLSMIDVCCQIYIQKYISISWKIVFPKKQSIITKHLLPNRNEKCSSFHTIHLITTFL